MNHGELGKFFLRIDHNLIEGPDNIAPRQSICDIKYCDPSFSDEQIVSMWRVDSHRGATFLGQITDKYRLHRCW